MTFDSQTHRRRSLRLQAYDYSLEGAYYVTVCVQDRACLFGDVIEGQMRLNEAGRMIQAQWEGLPRRFPQIDLDVFVVMPNHIHGILLVTEGGVGAGVVPAVGGEVEEGGSQGGQGEGEAALRAPTRGAPTGLTKGFGDAGSTVRPVGNAIVGAGLVPALGGEGGAGASQGETGEGDAALRAPTRGAPTGWTAAGRSNEAQGGPGEGDAALRAPTRGAPTGLTQGFEDAPGLTRGFGDPDGTGPAAGDGPTLGDVIGAFKSLTTVLYGRGVRASGWPGYRGRLWQRNFYEHIIRNERSLFEIRQYILENPLRWELDEENPQVARPAKKTR